MCGRRLRALIVVGLMIAAALPAAAARSAWRTAPLWGADVRSLAVHPDDPDVVLAGTSSGQVYLSQDGGRSWADAGAHLPAGWVVGSLRFDPNRLSRVWAGMWGIWGSGYVAFSDDLGETWVARGDGLSGEPVHTLALVPGREGVIYAATRSGVWGTEDGGLSWRYLTRDFPEIEKVTSLMIDPRDPDVVLAGTWRRAYRSADGGLTWSGIFEGMVLDSEVFTLTPVPGRDGEVWASTCGWVYRSADGGTSWKRFKEGLSERRTPGFAVLPTGRLLAGTVAGLYVSDTGGTTWARHTDDGLSIQSIAIHPERPRRVLLATEGAGVWVSEDGAESFAPSVRGMTNLRVAALAAAGPELLVAVNHAGPRSGIHVSTDGGRTFAPEPARLPTVLDLAVHRGRAYAATEKGLFERRGGEWRRVAELGEARVEQIAASGSQLVARTATGLFELADEPGGAGARFVPRPFKHGVPRSAAFHQGDLWVSGADGLYRLTRDVNDTVVSPFGGGRLDTAGDRLFLWSAQKGIWTRADEGSLWVELTAAKSAKIVRTGDARYPIILVEGDRAELYVAADRELRKLDLPIPGREIASALIQGDRLLLGTSGHGLLIGDLEPEPAGGGTVAVRP